MTTTSQAKQIVALSEQLAKLRRMRAQVDGTMRVTCGKKQEYEIILSPVAHERMRTGIIAHFDLDIQEAEAQLAALGHVKD